MDSETNTAVATSFDTAIRGLVSRHLADHRKVDVVGFVDQLFHLAGSKGSIGCQAISDLELRFVLERPQEPAQTACVVEMPAARSLLRMMCARLGVLCQEGTGRDISLYGDSGVFEKRFELNEPARWNVSYANTPGCQRFLIECVAR